VSEHNLRILGLDIGSKRIGVALSDELGFTAQGLETVQSRGIDNDIKAIAELAAQHSVTEIVVGVPYDMNGSEGVQAKKAKEFAERLSQRTGLPVGEWDERLSTVAAERALLEADMSRAKRRKVIDKVAAVIILQGYLDAKSFRGAMDK
jgi:putative Holliday junction resolvase